MAKGRHRKGGQQLTVLPAGSKVQTGKARSANKAAQYNQPLPISLSSLSPRSPNALQSRSQRQRNVKPTSSSWSQFIFSLIGWGTKSQTSSDDNSRAARPEIVTAQYDPITQTIHVEVTQSKDQRASPSPAMQLLWECGFFGKGTLSRSEPTWRTRQIQNQKVARQRAKGVRMYTAEELTALRRKERKAAKIERARLAVRAGQQLADGIIALGGELNEEDELAIKREVQNDLAASSSAQHDESQYGKHIPGLIYLKPTAKVQTEDAKVEKSDGDVRVEDDDEFEDIEDMESLQLSYHEVFFLSGMLGILDVLDESQNEMSLEHLYKLFLYACLPSRHRIHSPFVTPSIEKLNLTTSLWARPDNPFLLQYVAYHHFRSLGWVVRTGVKFCVDWLLYKRGPAFSHAEFAVVILPIYENPKDQMDSPFGSHPTGDKRDWVWFSSVNRVNTQVLKTLILCYIVIPPISSTPAKMLSTPEAFVEGLKTGNSYRIREYAIRRFTPQRMRA